MNNTERKKRRKEVEAKGFTFKYKRGNAEVGGGYAVYHKGKLIAPGQEVSMDEAIEWAEKQGPNMLSLRKLLMG